MKTTRLDGEDGNTRKYVSVKILGKEVKLQLDSGSDLTILNYHTWKWLGKPTMMHTKKVARSVLGEKINFEGEVITNVTLKNKTKKLRLFVVKNTNNLFGTDWLDKFELWDSPISDFCKIVKNHATEVFCSGLGRRTKIVASFELKEGVQPVCKKGRSVPFASRKKIDQELDRMVATGILSKVKENKCDFFLERIKYLGHIIEKNGRRPEPDRSTAIKNRPEPTKITSLQRPKMYELRAPLNKSLKKEKSWGRTTECKTKFEKRKETFPTHFNPDLPTIVASDTGSFGIGTCIQNKMPDGSKKPIAYTSRIPFPAENSATKNTTRISQNSNYRNNKSFLYDTFDLDSSQTAPQRCRSARKKKIPGINRVEPQEKKILKRSLRDETKRGGCCGVLNTPTNSKNGTILSGK